MSFLIYCTVYYNKTKDVLASDDTHKKSYEDVSEENVMEGKLSI